MMGLLIIVLLIWIGRCSSLTHVSYLRILSTLVFDCYTTRFVNFNCILPIAVHMIAGCLMVHCLSPRIAASLSEIACNHPKSEPVNGRGLSAPSTIATSEDTGCTITDYEQPKDRKTISESAIVRKKAALRNGGLYSPAERCYTRMTNLTITWQETKFDLLNGNHLHVSKICAFFAI